MTHQLKETDMKTRINNKTMLLSTIVGAWLAVAAAPLYADEGEAVFNKTCKLCHGSGMAGAPKAGDADAWKDRIAKGRSTLYDHALNGFRDKGIMPPRGGNSALTDDEVKAAVDYMVGLVN
jgi:cytochrome c5